jgi:hypothetical protein
MRIGKYWSRDIVHGGISDYEGNMHDGICGRISTGKMPCSEIWMPIFTAKYI